MRVQFNMYNSFFTVVKVTFYVGFKLLRDINIYKSCRERRLLNVLCAFDSSSVKESKYNAKERVQEKLLN